MKRDRKALSCRRHSANGSFPPGSAENTALQLGNGSASLVASLGGHFTPGSIRVISIQLWGQLVAGKDGLLQARLSVSCGLAAVENSPSQTAPGCSSHLTCGHHAADVISTGSSGGHGTSA